MRQKHEHLVWAGIPRGAGALWSLASVPARVSFDRHSVRVRAIGFGWLLPATTIGLDAGALVSIAKGSALGWHVMTIDARGWSVDLRFPVTPNAELIEEALEIPFRVVG